MTMFEWIRVIWFGWYYGTTINPTIFFIINPIVLFFLLKFIFKNKLEDSILFSLAAHFFTFFFVLAGSNPSSIELIEVKKIVLAISISPLYHVISCVFLSFVAQSIFFILIGLSLKKRVWPFIAATCMSNIITGFIVIYFF